MGELSAEEVGAVVGPLFWPLMLFLWDFGLVSVSMNTESVGVVSIEHSVVWEESEEVSVARGLWVLMPIASLVALRMSLPVLEKYAFMSTCLLPIVTLAEGVSVVLYALMSSLTEDDRGRAVSFLFLGDDM